MKFENIKRLEPVDPNEVCLKDVNPIVQVLKAKETEAWMKGHKLMALAYSDAKIMIEEAPRIGAAEFVKQETGKTIQELAEELPLYEILQLIDKLYYEYQRFANTAPVKYPCKMEVPDSE